MEFGCLAVHPDGEESPLYCHCDVRVPAVFVFLVVSQNLYVLRGPRRSR